VSLSMLAGMLYWNSQTARTRDVRPLIVYCAVSLQPPVEEIARLYEAEVGVPVQVEYGGSQVLLARLELRRDGDVFIPADDDYLRIAEEKGLISSRTPLTRLRPVVAVAGGNPRGIATIKDLLRKDVKLAIPDPKTAAIGRLVRARLGERWEAIWSHARLVRTTVGDVASDVRLGVADATFAWDDTVRQMPGLSAVELPEFAGVEAHVAAGLLTTTQHLERAQDFGRYLSASDRGQPVFQKRGYQTISGSPWTRPEGR
jgi:molybdate transport system substrate-binding protein